MIHTLRGKEEKRLPSPVKRKKERKEGEGAPNEASPSCYFLSPPGQKRSRKEKKEEEISCAHSSPIYLANSFGQVPSFPFFHLQIRFPLLLFPYLSSRGGDVLREGAGQEEKVPPLHSFLATGFTLLLSPSLKTNWWKKSRREKEIAIPGTLLTLSKHIWYMHVLFFFLELSLFLPQRNTPSTF